MSWQEKIERDEFRHNVKLEHKAAFGKYFCQFTLVGIKGFLQPKLHCHHIVPYARCRGTNLAVSALNGVLINEDIHGQIHYESNHYGIPVEDVTRRYAISWFDHIESKYTNLYIGRVKVVKTLFDLLSKKGLLN